MKASRLAPLSLLYDWYRWRACRLNEEKALALSSTVASLMFAPRAARRRNNMLKFYGETNLSREQQLQIDRDYIKYQTNFGVEIVRGGVVSLDLLKERNPLVGEEHLQAALKEGKGVLLLTPHIGNFYGFLMTLAANGYDEKLTGVSEPVPVASMEDQANILRARFKKTKTVFIGKGAARAAAKVFRQAGILSIFFDVGVRSEELVWLPFGRTTIGLDSGPVRLAVRFGVAVLPSTAYIQKPFHSEMRIEPAFAPVEGADEETRVYNTLVQWKDWLEKEVTKCPEQWWPWSFLELGKPPKTK